MVNTEEFTKRLNTIMDYYGLSAASFADKVEVGRSSISHLLSGRNNPSLDFVLKVIQAFPEVELYWLLNGKGSFPHSQKAPAPYKKKEINNPSPDLFYQPEHPETKNPEKMTREIRKIVIFYSDGTFEAFEN